MEQTIKQQQQELIEMLQQRQEELLKMFAAEGYVVAGYGGDTYYSFEGTGMGFNGAALAPLSRRPHIFTTKQEAQREADNGIYRNGRDEVIALKVEEARTYFRKIHAEIEKNIQVIKEQFSKQ